MCVFIQLPQYTSRSTQGMKSISCTATCVLAAPVAGPVRIAPKFESFYTVPPKSLRWDQKKRQKKGQNIVNAERKKEKGKKRQKDKKQNKHRHTDELTVKHTGRQKQLKTYEER